MTDKLPLNPGYILKNEFMVPLNITGYKLAQDLNITQVTISQIINAKRRITTDVAIRLSRYFGNSPGFWLNLQDIYDLKITLREKKDSYKSIKPFNYAKKRETA
jgi:addiction module HigA family antidote